MIGTPSEAELEQIPDREIQNRLRGYTLRHRRSFCEEMPHVDDAGISLIEAMLQFLPGNRMPMAEVVKQPFFRRVRRSPDDTKHASGPIAMGFTEASLCSKSVVQNALKEQVEKFPCEAPKTKISSVQR